jgi:hypothetical protein
MKGGLSMSKKPLKPGEKAPQSGIYGIVNRYGNDTGVERTVDKNEKLPPTPKKGQNYVIKRKSKTK